MTPSITSTSNLATLFSLLQHHFGFTQTVGGGNHLQDCKESDGMPSTMGTKISPQRDPNHGPRPQEIRITKNQKNGMPENHLFQYRESHYIQSQVFVAPIAYDQLGTSICETLFLYFHPCTGGETHALLKRN